MKRYNEQSINIYAGRPGAGKTHWARKEICNLLIDPNNIVVYIGHSEMNAKLAEESGNLPGKLYMSDDLHAAQAIGVAIDAANMDRAMFPERDESEIAQRNHRQVFIFFDQCRQLISNGHRDLLVAAAKAGVSVNVLCQVFHQVDKGDLKWLAENCTCNIISKGREPRIASKDEREASYR